MFFDLISRILNIFGAKGSKLIQHFEDPNETLDWSYEKMLKGLQASKLRLADVVAQQKGMERQVRAVDGEIAQAEGDARAALRAHREDLAREALASKQSLLEKRSRVDQALTDMTVQVDKLVGYQHTLQERIERFKTDKEVTKASYSAAVAQVKATQSIAGVGEGLAGVGSTLLRAEERVTGMRNKADAMGTLLESNVMNDPLDRRSPSQKEMGRIRQSTAIDDEMAALKAEMEGATPLLAGPQIPTTFVGKERVKAPADRADRD